MSDPAAGWHADPAGTTGTYRWWDGQAWTRWLSGDPAAPSPPASLPEQQTTPEQVAPEQAVPVAQPGAAPDDIAARLAPEHPAEPLVRLPVAVAVVVGVVLIAVVAVGAVVSASAQDLPSGPAVAPPPRTSTRAVGYDTNTRVTSVGKLRMTLAAPPYLCDTSPQPALPTFDDAVACNAPVHANYDGDHHDWTATQAIGVVPADLVTAGDLEATGRQVFASARTQFFSRQDTTVTKLTVQPTDLGPDTQTIVVGGEVHYRVPKVASRYDRLLVVVVALPDGTHAVVVSSRPDDSGTTVQQTLQTSLDSITAR